MQIFVFFLYNRAGNKIDENCAQNVLTEARVSGLRASVLRTLDGQVLLSFLPSFAQPRLAPAGTPGSLSSPLLAALFLGWTALRAARQRPRLNAQSSESQESPDGLGNSSGLCLASLQPGEKLLRDFPPPRLALALLESKRRRWRAPLSPWPRSPACPRALLSPASRAPFLPLPQVKQVKAGAVAGTGSGGVRVWGHGAGSPGRGKGGGRDRPRLTERTRERRGCRWWSPPP